jgi:hypothetical protein
LRESFPSQTFVLTLLPRDNWGHRD